MGYSPFPSNEGVFEKEYSIYICFELGNWESARGVIWIHGINIHGIKFSTRCSDRLNLFIRIFFRRWVERFVAKQFDYVENTRNLKGTRYHVFRIQRKCNNNSKESLRHFSLEILYLGRGYEREKQEVVGSRGEKARETYCSVSLLSRGAATNDLIAHCHATRDFYFLSEAIFPRGFGFCRQHRSPTSWLIY